MVYRLANLFDDCIFFTDIVSQKSFIHYSMQRRSFREAISVVDRFGLLEPPGTGHSENQIRIFISLLFLMATPAKNKKSPTKALISNGLFL